jgi:CubicO group peptidase (beta-lactamase class C family)
LSFFLITPFIFCQENILSSAKLTSHQKLNQIIEDQMVMNNISGLSASIIKDGKEVWNINRGLAHRETNLAVSDSVSFLLYSATKLFTGIGIMQLWEEGLLELDDPVNDYLPFEVIHPDFPDTEITFRMLMSHVGGVRDNWTIINALMTFGYDTPVSLSEFCYRYFSEEGSYYNPDKSFNNNEPGTRWEYSNCGVTLLGYLIELISGQDYTEYIKEHILLPLEMENSTFYLSELDTSLLANEYIFYEDDYLARGFRSCPLLPAGFLHVKREEIRNFQFMILNHGLFNGQNIIDSTTLAMMQTRYYPDIAPNSGLIFGYDHINQLWGHTGGMNQNLKTSVSHSYEGNYGVTMLCNGAQDPWPILGMLYQYASEYEHLTAEFIEVLDDGDLIIESNEDVGINVSVQNNFQEDLFDIEAILHCTHSEVMLIDSIATISQITAGELSEDPLSFHVASGNISDCFEAAFTIEFFQDGQYLNETSFTLFFGEADILLVSDETHFYRKKANAKEFYQNAVDNAGFSNRTYEINRYNFPSAEFLNSFQAVVWFTGLDNVVYNDILSGEKQELLTQYLNYGGKLFLSSQNAGDAIGNTGFFQNYLHANHLNSNYQGYLRAVGSDENTIGDGMNFNLSGGDGSNICLSANVMEPLNNAEVLFHYYNTDSIAAISYSGFYKLVFCSFPFSAIQYEETRNELMDRILNFLAPSVGLQNPAEDKGSVIYPNPSDGEEINIRNSFRGVTTIQVFDNGGRLIYKKQFIDDDRSYQLPFLNKGLYFVVLLNDSGVLSEKLIVR